MPIYNDVFGGANIYPSEISYSAVTLTADIVLSWPEETSTNTNLATRIIDVTESTSGWSIFLPDAQKSGTGNTILFNNQGAYTFIVKNAGGTQVASIAAGTVWQVYLTSNTTTNGLWETLQFGATVSNANASALAGTGIVAVGTLLSQSVPITQFNTNYTAGTADRAKMYLWTGSGSGVLTLPSAATVGNDWFMYLRNSGGGQVTVTPSGINTIDGAATKDYQPSESSVIISDGTNFYTLGFGQASVFVFDYTVVDIAGSGTYTLSGSELNRIVYKFTGTLTGNRNVVVPSTVQQYWVDNATTGAYTLTVKTSAGAGIAVTQGSRGIYYCNGSDVVNADTRVASYPISVAQGGTGATNAGAALINLGGTSVGTAIFTATDEAAAWAALGIAPANVVVGGTF
jgi:hypothetical protein